MAQIERDEDQQTRPQRSAAAWIDPFELPANPPSEHSLREGVSEQRDAAPTRSGSNFSRAS